MPQVYKMTQKIVKKREERHL